jgi:hypothetical protein
MLGTLNDSTILRLRVKGSELDPLALRGRLESILGEVSFQPRLPASATLFIRKLSDPIPGLLQLDTTHPRAPEAWRHAFNTKFEQLVSSAARPAHGLVADSAESVVFYDHSELLASLSTDWCSGYVTSRWWWESLIKRGDVERVIKQHWREKIEYVPAALEHLVKRDTLVRFVSTLSDDEVGHLVQLLVQTFALNGMRRVVQLLTVFTRAPALSELEVESVNSHPPTFQRLQLPALMPWRYTVPESEASQLRPLQQLFVGLGLMLQRAPARVRSLSFAREVKDWQEQVITSLAATAPAISDTSETVSDTRQPEAEVTGDELVAPLNEVIGEGEHQSLASEIAPRDQVKIGNAVFTQEDPVSIPASVERSSSEVETVNDEPVEAQVEVETMLEVVESASESLGSITIDTEFGGLFYLINLGIFLEIYSDFTSPVEQFTELSIWDFVAIVGAEILGEKDPKDPVWSLLSDLAGHEKTGLQDSQDFQNSQSAKSSKTVNPDNPENPVPLWLGERMPQLLTRLRQALGITDEVDLAALLLRHHARVTLTPTHLDVFLLFANLPIEVRMSGLDRNPGWAPAAGRFIAFHYD